MQYSAMKNYLAIAQLIESFPSSSERVGIHFKRYIHICDVIINYRASKLLQTVKRSSKSLAIITRISTPLKLE